MKITNELISLAKKLPRVGDMMARFKVEELAEYANEFSKETKIVIITQMKSVKQIISQMHTLRNKIWKEYYKK
jgi:acetolactate synthase small subunit